MEKKKVLIGVIAYDGVAIEALEDYFVLFHELGKKHNDKYQFFLKVMSRREQFRCRNLLVEIGMGLEADYMWQLDEDMVIPRDTFGKLVEVLESAPDIGVVGALYTQRDDPHHPVLMRGSKFPDGRWFTEYHAYYQLPGGPMDVAVAGGGCFLFRMESFKEMIEPYFWSDGITGTDVQICLRLREMGWRVVCHTGAIVGHVGSGNVWYPSNVPNEILVVDKEKERLAQDAETLLGLDIIKVEDTAMRLAPLIERRWYTNKRDTQVEVNQFYMEPEIQELNLYKGIMYHAFSKDGYQGYRWLAKILARRPGVVPDRKEPLMALDYGCGVSLAGAILQRAGYRVMLADLPTKAFEFGVNRLKPRDMWRLDPSEGLPKQVPDLRFSIVAVMDVIEHLKDPEPVVRMLAGLLEPNGILFTNAHTADFMGASQGCPQHIKTIDAKRLQEIFKDCGLRQTDIDQALIKEV
uniref:Putative methyltransferase n=1 Tax=viral metagenome TaxID=1070528 RepID=A0A6M3L7L4_9ZZZZ